MLSALGCHSDSSVTRLDEIKSPAAVRGFFVASVVTGLVSLPTDGLKQGAFLWNYATDRTSCLQASLKSSRAGLYTICYQQVTTQKIAVYLRRNAKREPVTRQLPSRVTVWMSALVRLPRSANLLAR